MLKGTRGTHTTGTAPQVLPEYKWMLNETKPVRADGVFHLWVPEGRLQLGVKVSEYSRGTLGVLLQGRSDRVLQRTSVPPPLRVRSRYVRIGVLNWYSRGTLGVLQSTQGSRGPEGRLMVRPVEVRTCRGTRYVYV